jgi:hypothetical protein
MSQKRGGGGKERLSSFRSKYIFDNRRREEKIYGDERKEHIYLRFFSYHQPLQQNLEKQINKKESSAIRSHMSNPIPSSFP